MPLKQTFAFKDLAIRVEAEDPWLLQWLEEFLTPAFTLARESGAAACTVAVAVDGREYQRTLQADPDTARVGCFALDRGLVSLASWESAVGGERVVFDDRANVFYFVGGDGSRIRVLARRQRQWWRVAVMRAVREVALARCWMGDSLVLHAGALVRGEHGIALAGPKRAGKTTLLFHLLQTPAAAFVSNDRVVVDLDGPNPALHAMPTVVTIRSDTLRRLPFLNALASSGYDHRVARGEVSADLDAASHRDPDQPITLSPRQLCEALGVDRRGRAPWRTLLFPRVTERPGGIELRSLSPPEAAARLTGLLPGGVVPPLRSQAFGLAPHRARDIDVEDVRRLCLRFAAQLDCFDVALGQQAYEGDSAARLLDSVTVQR